MGDEVVTSRRQPSEEVAHGGSLRRFLEAVALASLFLFWYLFSSTPPPPSSLLFPRPPFFKTIMSLKHWTQSWFEMYVQRKCSWGTQARDTYKRDTSVRVAILSLKYLRGTCTRGMYLQGCDIFEDFLNLLFSSLFNLLFRDIRASSSRENS